MLSEQGRMNVTVEAERALGELTYAASRLGIAPIVTPLLVSLWESFHDGAPPPLVRHKAPVLDKPLPDPTRKAARPNLGRIASPEGQQALQDILQGLLTQREAARRLGVHPNAICEAVRRLRQKAVGDPAETVLSFR
jgi:hypothetical protein